MDAYRLVFSGVFILGAAAVTVPRVAVGQALPEVVVTAQKRPELAQAVPITLTALDRDEFKASEAKDLFQVANYVPGMVFSRAPDDGLALTLRGIGTPARSEAFDQSVAVFLDGLFLAKGRLYTAALFDVERLEVIKGTQTTLLGKNASIGAISIESRLPGSSFAAEARGLLETVHGGETVDGAIDLPMSEALAVRIAAHYNDTHGWVRNTATGRDVPIDQDTGVRVTGRFSSDSSLGGTLSYQHGLDERIGVPYQIVDGHLPPAFGEGLFDDQESEVTNRNKRRETTHHTDSDLINLKLEWRLGRLNAVSQSGFIHYGLRFDDDFDFSNQPWTDFIRTESYAQVSEEFRLLSPSEQPLEYLAGVFVFHSRWHSVEQQAWGVPGFPPGSPIAGQLFNGPFTNDFRQNTDNQALFGRITWHLSERWGLSMGLRAAHESKNVIYGRSSAPPLTIWNTQANPPFPATPLDFSDSFVDGNASIQLELRPRIMGYLGYSHGTKTGGFVETNTVASANPAMDARVDNEATQTVELGFKSSWRQDALRLNGALFYSEVRGFQDTTFTGTAFITENLPLTSQGIELETEWQARASLRLGGAVTYAHVVERPTALDFADGVQCDPCGATQAPLWSGSFHIAYQHALTRLLNWGLSAHLHYRSPMFNQRGDLYRSTSFMPIDLGLNISANNARYGANLLAKNIANRLTEDFSSPSVAPYFAGLASPAPLRSITLGVWAKL